MSTILIALTGEQKERGEKLIELTKKLSPKMAVFTGSHSKLGKKAKVSEAASFYQSVKKRLGLKASQVKLEEKSQDTRDHFIYLPELLKEELADPKAEFVIITNWWHMPKVRLAAWLHWPEARGRLKFASANTGASWQFIVFNRTWWEPISAAVILYKYFAKGNTPHPT